MGGIDTTDVAILCGGKGERLRSEIGESQKVMTQIEGHPFLDILISTFMAQGFRRFVLCAGYRAEAIEEHYRHQTGDRQIVISREEKPLGTGGALKNARSKINSDPFIALNGDCFCRADFRKFIDFQKKKGHPALMVTAAPENSEDYGGIVMDDDNRILDFSEKAGSRKYVSVGAYCLPQEVFIHMPDQRSFSIEYDVFPNLAKEGLYGYYVEEEFLDIGTPERLKKAQTLFKDNKDQ